MSSIIADAAMAAILKQAQTLTEIRDGNGQVIGFFAPIAIPNAQAYANAATHLDPGLARERSRKEGKVFTTKEVFEKLMSLTQDEQMKNYLQAKIHGLVERDRCVTP